jgi:hypothetical protein
MLGDFPADLGPVHHGLAPMQPGPHSSIVNLAHERIEIVVGPLGSDQLANDRPAGGQSPCDLICPEDLAIESVWAVDE